MPRSVKISFAPGTLYAERGAAALRPILERTSVLFVNQEEARLLTGRWDARAAASNLVRLGCQIVVVTLGEGMEIERADSAPLRGLRPGPRSGAGTERGSREPRGKRGKARAACFVTDGKVEEALPPIGTARIPADNVGAGDAFAAGFLYGLLTDRPLGECARLGQLVAQASLRAPGAREALPDLRQVRRAYRRLFGANLC